MRIFSSLQRLWVTRDGSVLIFVGLGFLILVALGGAGIDMGRAQLIHAKFQQGTDGAGLAYAGLPGAATPAQRTAAANRYFQLNVPAVYMGVARPALSIAPDGTGGVTISTAAVQMPTNFIRFAPSGPTELTISATSRISANSTPVAYDLVLAIDNSGSMADDVGSPVPTRPGGGTPRDNGVNTCLAYYHLILDPHPEFGPVDESICRGMSDGGTPPTHDPALGLTNSSRLNAALAAADIIANRLLNPNTTGSRVGVVTWSTFFIAEQPLVSDYSAVKTALNNMFAFGATNSTAGLEHAQAQLAGLAPGHVPAVVLLTDGFNTTTARNLHYVDTSVSPSNVLDDDNCTTWDKDLSDTPLPVCSATNSASLSACRAIKANGGVVYTIAFGADVTTGSQAAAAQDFLKNCASGDPATNTDQFFFIAPDAATLDDAFTKILVSLKKIRISG